MYRKILRNWDLHCIIKQNQAVPNKHKKATQTAFKAQNQIYSNCNTINIKTVHLITKAFKELLYNIKSETAAKQQQASTNWK